MIDIWSFPKSRRAPQIIQVIGQWNTIDPTVFGSPLLRNPRINRFCQLIIIKPWTIHWPEKLDSFGMVALCEAKFQRGRRVVVNIYPSNGLENWNLNRVKDQHALIVAM